MSSTNNKKIEISVLRILATVAIVFLHTCNTLTSNRDRYMLSEEQYGFFSSGTALMMWAVPCFLMITGELLLDSKKHIDLRTALTKYVKRPLIALFVFGIPFSMMELIMERKTLSISMFFDATINVINGESWDHLWYLYALVGIYLIIPFLKILVDNCSRELQLGLIVILFVFNCIIPFMDRLLRLNIEFVFPITGYTVMYLLIGKYITDNYDTIKFSANKNILWIVLLGIVIVFMTLVAKEDYLKYVGYNSPVTVLQSVLVYTLGKNMKRIGLSSQVDKVWKIDRLCFGVYLIHTFFINLSYKMFNWTPVSSERYYLNIFLYTGIFVLLSFVASWLMSKIKLLKKYVL